MREQNRQLREDMNIRFEEHSRLILGILAAFTALLVINVSLVVWDRRTAARPFEEKVAGIAEELAQSRSRWDVLLEAVRAVGQQNQAVAAVLRRFNLLVGAGAVQDKWLLSLENYSKRRLLCEGIP